MTRPAVAVRGLRKHYGKTVALDGLDLTVRPGSITGLVGPNGCGKTTLMRTLVGLLKPTAGGARVLGKPPSAVQRRDGPKVGYMPQQGGMYPDLTVRQNVSFFASVLGVPKHRRHEWIDGALRYGHLEDREDTKVRELSGGLARRASLCCAVVHRPDLLLLDEPTVGVDPEIRERIWESLREVADRGVTVLVSTHYLGEAEECDEVALMRRGRLLAQDSPRTLMDQTGTDTLEAAFVRLVA